jgi:rod shape-determining protein MreD
MKDERQPMQYIEVYRASKHLKYDHVQPGGAVQVIYCIVSVLLLMLIQNGFFSAGGFQFYGQSPFLVLVFVYLVSVKCKPGRPVVLGVLSGLAVDILFGRYVGLYAIMMMYTALVISCLADKFLDTKLRIIAFGVPVFLIFRITESFFIRLLSMILGGGTCLYTNYISHFTGYIIPWVVYNELCLAVMAVPVYALWRRCSPH